MERFSDLFVNHPVSWMTALTASTLSDTFIPIIGQLSLFFFFQLFSFIFEWIRERYLKDKRRKDIDQSFENFLDGKKRGDETKYR